MIKEVIEYLLDIASKHRKIKHTQYGDRSLFNRSNENESYQFFIEDVNYLREEREGVNELELNCYILGFVDDIKTNLDVQDETLHIWEDIHQYLDNDADIQISIRDYDLLALSEYTTDKDAGIRITLRLYVPNVVDKCSYLDNFDFNNVKHMISYKSTYNSNQQAYVIDFGSGFWDYVDSLYCIELKQYMPQNVRYLNVHNDNIYHFELKWKANLTSLKFCFSTCSIYEFDKDLFSECKNVTDISNLFNNNRYIETIPQGLFDYFTNVTKAQSVFSYCHNITYIPEGLMNNMVELQDALGIFGRMDKLQTVPKYLFTNNKKITNMQSIFYGNPKLKNMPYDKYSDGSEKPLWERSGEYALVTNHTEAFKDCTSIINYEQIPDDWK